ncbi:MAG: hypothetical protein PWQ25_1566 [Deferribacteres bacterium]|jgi:hypothetical protein|nr:hypothetical protein [Deferribacteres bacterium]
MRKILFLFLLYFGAASYLQSTEITCDKNYDISLKIKVMPIFDFEEPTLIFGEIVCKDSNSTIIKVQGRYLRNKVIKYEKVLNENIGKNVTIPVTKEMIIPYFKE